MVATQLLVTSANGVVTKNEAIEPLIVSGHEVQASVVQVVAAARVKQVPFSKTQGPLEKSAYSVTECTKELVKLCQNMNKQVHSMMDMPKNAHDYKTVEMEQQVKILGLEKDLQLARQDLGQLRKMGYQQ